MVFDPFVFIHLYGGEKILAASGRFGFLENLGEHTLTVVLLDARHQGGECRFGSPPTTYYYYAVLMYS